jgi:4-hydroxy-3-methylbut-2-en-1-yl diphosphate synthase IspG/GcpE
VFSTPVENVENLINGWRSKVSVQSILHKPSEDVGADLVQTNESEETYCRIVRVSVPNQESLHTHLALQNNFGFLMV